MTCYPTMERERTRRQRSLRPGNGGYCYFSSRQGTKIFSSEGVFWNCLLQMGGLQRCFLIRGYHGLARSGSRKKKTVPEPKVALLSLGSIRW